jgi:hypothetical protein
MATNLYPRCGRGNEVRAKVVTRDCVAIMAAQDGKSILEAGRRSQGFESGTKGASKPFC